MVAIAVAMVVATPNLPVTQINLLELKDGKIEVMEILLKIPNMKVEGLEEKEGFPIMMLLLMKIVNNLISVTH